MTPERRFLHRLALGLGRTVGELEHGISARELDDWVAFWHVEPWGTFRDNIHSGLIASVIANVNRKAGSRAFSYADFMLTERDPAADKAKAANIVNFFRRASKKKTDAS